MAGIIKNYGYQNISVLQDEPVMTTVYGKKLPAGPAQQMTPQLTPQAAPKAAPQQPAPQMTRPLPAGTETAPFAPPSFGEDTPAEAKPAADAAPDADKQREAPAPAKTGEFAQPAPPAPKETVSAEEARIEREQLAAEYEAMRAHYEEQSEQYILRARKKADEVYQKTREMAEDTLKEARAEAEKIKAAAAEEGRQKGYDEGMKQGYDDGYTKALKKCKDSLLELKALSEAVTAEKNDIFMRYERQLFDAIFEIAQKITINSLNQHDKGVITKMLREAGKKYKASKHITIMLSKLDVEENAEIDEELVRGIFKSSENVEIEILPDAPKGTLIIDNGSEITDAGVATQLQIIEQLGSGKYRDKSFNDMIREGAGGASKKKKAADKPAESGQAAADGAEASPDSGESADGSLPDDDVIPDVTYTDGTDSKNG